MHFLSWSLLKGGCSAIRTHAIVTRIGAWLPAISSPDEARRVSRSLLRHGTCLSRSLALAARTPTADVVIGVAPRKDAPLHAHAWVEMEGGPIDPSDVSGAPIARLHGRRSPTRGTARSSGF